MNDGPALRPLRLTGIAGILGAIGWMIGDALIVGGSGKASDFPILLGRYADRIPLAHLEVVLSSLEPRLAAGALIADITVRSISSGAGISTWARRVRGDGGRRCPCIADCRQCLVAARPCGVLLRRGWPIIRSCGARGRASDVARSWRAVQLCAADRLDIAGGHAGPCAAGAGDVIALGRTTWPRWMAAVINPLVLIGSVSRLLPEPLQTWFAGAGFNIGWFVVYLFSTALLWNGGVQRGAFSVC